MEMEIGNGNGNAPIAGAHAQGSIAQDTAYRVEMVLCAAMEEGTEGFVVITCVLL